MNYEKALSLLYAEREKLNRVIESLERLAQTPALPRSRRGRKSMGAEERKEVSERMKRYWAQRRKAKTASR